MEDNFIAFKKQGVLAVMPMLEMTAQGLLDLVDGVAMGSSSVVGIGRGNHHFRPPCSRLWMLICP